MKSEYKGEKEKFILLDSMPIGVCVINKNLEVIFWNKCLETWTNIHRDQILNKPIDVFFPHFKTPKYYIRLQQAFKGSPATIFSSQLHKHFIPSPLPNYRLRIQHTIVISIPSFLKNTYEAMIVIQDVTELTERMQDQKSMKDQALIEVEYRKKIEKELSEKTNKLLRQNLELTQLYNISQLLQNCPNLEKAYSIISDSVELLFPNLAGVIFFINQKREIQKIIQWGNFAGDDNYDIFKQSFFSWHKNNELIKQFNFDESKYLYFPLKIKEKQLGFMYLSTNESEKIDSGQRIFAMNFVEQISLILLNISIQNDLYEMSIRDGLTGLYNRRYLEDYLAKELNRAERKTTSIGIIMIDIDHFKKINDNFGHQAGDLVLKAIGNVLEKNIRQYDFACRYGGEELTIILPETSLNDIIKKAEEIRIAIKSLKVIFNNQELPNITASFGVASFPEHGLTSQAILRAADVALFQAKKQGRNCVVAAQ